MGLVHDVVEEGEVQRAAKQLAEKIARASGFVIRHGKKTLKKSSLGERGDHAVAAAAMVEGLQHEDSVEGIGAFLGKRAPVWKE